jgi:hypothetical protein
MDNGLVTDNVIDTMANKLLDNVTLNNSHTTWNNSANRVPFSNKYLCATLNISETQRLTSNDTINVEQTIVKDSSQVPQNKSLKIFHQDIRGLRNKYNEQYCHLNHDLLHILYLPEHHLSESELQLIHLTNYSLGANCCRKTFHKVCVSIFVYRN